MTRKWPDYLVPLRHAYPLGWRSSSVLAGIGSEDQLTLREIAARFRLGHYDARQVVRRLERRRLLEVVGERRTGAPGRPPLVYRRTSEGEVLAELRRLNKILRAIG